MQELVISEPIIEPFTWECREELPIGMAFRTVQLPVPYPLMCRDSIQLNFNWMLNRIFNRVHYTPFD